MRGLAPRETATLARETLEKGIEILLILVMVCLLAAIAGVVWARPGIKAELEKNRVMDQLLSAPIPAVPGETCGSLVRAACRANAASAHWDVARQASPGRYLITVTFRRGAESAIFHWDADLSRQTITSVEKRSICPLP